MQLEAKLNMENLDQKGCKELMKERSFKMAAPPALHKQKPTHFFWQMPPSVVVVGAGSTSRESSSQTCARSRMTVPWFGCHHCYTTLALLCLWCCRMLHQGWAWLLSSLSLPGRYPQSNNLVGLWAVVHSIPQRMKAASGIIFYSALLNNAKTLNTALRKIMLSMCIVVMLSNHCLCSGSCHGGAEKNTPPHPLSEPSIAFPGHS